jgi:multiple antibiotic resistance protein
MADSIAAFVGVVTLPLAALLPLINPPGLAPIFLSMTRNASDPDRTALARRIARNSFVLLLGAMLIGSYVLFFFGLSLAVIKIAGGLLVISTAWGLTRPAPNPEQANVAAAAPPTSEDQLLRHDFYPLTFPLTIGPGSISVTVALGAGIRGGSVAAEVTSVLGAIAGLAIVSTAVYYSYRFASRLLGVLGGTGTVVMLNLSAFILLAVGVRILCDGLAEQFAILKPPA